MKNPMKVLPLRNLKYLALIALSVSLTAYPALAQAEGQVAPARALMALSLIHISEPTRPY